MKGRAAALAAAPLLLAACVGAGGGDPTGSRPAVPDGPVFPVAFDEGGIDVVGSGQRIDFGRAQAGVIQTMTRLEGETPETAPCDAPGLGAAFWRGGALLVFRDGTFVGWRDADGRSAGTSCVPILPD